MSSKKVTKQDLLQAINNLEKNPHDKLGILADLGIGAVGAVSAGAAVAAFGGTSVLFGLITVAPPVGLVVGGAALGASALVGLKKIFFDGTFNEGYRQKLLEDLRQQLRDVEAKERAYQLGESDKTQFIVSLKKPIELNLISPEDAQKLIQTVESGKILLTDAIRIVQDLVKSAKI